MNEETIIIEESNIKARCQKCKNSTACKVHRCVQYKYDTDDEGSDYSVYGSIKYYILECKGCGYIFFQTIKYFSEYPHDNPLSIDIYPKIEVHPVDDEVDRYIQDWFCLRMYREICIAIDNELPTLAMMGIRSFLDRLIVSLTEGDTGKYKDNLDVCKTKKIITDAQHAWLNTVIQAGHRAVHDSHLPETSDTINALKIVEDFVKATLAMQGKAQKLEARTPERPKNRKVRAQEKNASTTPPPPSSLPNPPDGGDGAD